VTVDRGAIERLVARCEALSTRARQGYNESNTRKDFIDPLFEALGWDVRNKEEVDSERFVRPGFADYAFVQHGVVRFFLESKKLEDDLEQEEYVRQVITYAYSRGVSWAVLCNFSRMVVFDAQEELDGSRPRYVLNLGCEDYVARADLLSLLTPESILGGRLTDHAVSIGVRRRPVPIEKRLYQAMRRWREDLFNGMSHYGVWKTQKELRHGDEAIQRLLDRLIFLRNCEDRGIGEPGLRGLRNRLHTGGQDVHVTEGLMRLFDQATRTYDSELFETNALIDVFLRGLGTNLDETLGRVIEGMYSVPKSFAAYDFSLIDADVLGQVYEQYLGHVARRVRKLAAQEPLPGMPAPEISVEEKRQRRKEHGIYYTPRWVVDYVVAQTVGRFLAERRSDSDAIANVRILDPACGSGSFLIRAYEALLEHHAAQMGGDVGHLDRQTREWILRHNIFGVDLDPQAVEIARLNLLMRMVREEEELPLLRENIVHGNSLISGDTRELQQYFGNRWEAKRPLRWAREFPELMADGGFDVVVGNPPYHGFQGFEDEKNYLRDKYTSAVGRFDYYIPFVEQAYRLLKPGGLLGFICPTNFMKRQHGAGLRDFLRKNVAILGIHDFQDMQAFEGALNYTGILVFRKSEPSAGHTFEYGFRDLGGEASPVLQRELSRGPWIVRPGGDSVVSKVVNSNVIPLRTLSSGISEGIVTGKNDVFLIKERDARVLQLEDEMLRKALRGRAIRRYDTRWDGTYVIYPYRLLGDELSVVQEGDLAKTYPKTYRYLCQRRPLLEGRTYFEKSQKQWYELWCERDFGQQASNKILTPEIAEGNRFAKVSNEYFYLDTACGIVLKTEAKESDLYVLAVLNSKLIQYVYRYTTVPKANGFLIYKTMYLNDVPMRRIDFSNEAEANVHDNLVLLVERMTELKRELAGIGEAHDEEWARAGKEMERTDREIDQLVYDLYGLTQEERAVVENEFAR